MDPLLILVPMAGLAVGSFLNVLITRLPDPERSLLRPLFSACPRCEAPIRARDNVPLLSYALLGGRCRSCRQPISVLYPAVEAGTAALLLAALLSAGGWGLPFAHAAVFLVLLLAVAVTDARTYLIPDAYTFGGTAVGLALAAAMQTGVLERMGEAALLAGGLWLLGRAVGRAVKKSALGDGDVVLLAMMTVFLGFGAAVLALYLAAASGLVTHVARRRSCDTLIPFGLHLAVGGALALFLGDTSYGQLIESFLPWH